jgi:hypothetical protein
MYSYCHAMPSGAGIAGIFHPVGSFFTLSSLAGFSCAVFFLGAELSRFAGAPLSELAADLLAAPSCRLGSRVAATEAWDCGPLSKIN